MTSSDAAIGIAIVTGEGEIVEVNRALCQMTGHTTDQLVSRHVSRFVPGIGTTWSPCASVHAIATWPASAPLRSAISRVVVAR